MPHGPAARQPYPPESLVVDPWLNIHGAAGFTGYAVETLYNKIWQAKRGAENPIPFHRVNNRLRFRASELEAWLRRSGGAAD